MSLVLSLPWPPTVNTYWRHWQGRTLISKKGRQYRQAVAGECIAKGVAGINLDGSLIVEIDAFPPDKRRRDLDNLLKALLDALGHAGVYEDDSLIDRLTVTRGAPVLGGSVIVTIDQC